MLRHPRSQSGIVELFNRRFAAHVIGEMVRDLRRTSIGFGSLWRQVYTSRGVERRHKIPGHIAHSEPCGAKSGGHSAPSPSPITHLANALAALPEVERPALVEHVKALARLSAAKRAAAVTLVADDG